MSAAVAQTITGWFLEGQNEPFTLRAIGRGNPLALSADLSGIDDDTVAAQESWTLEIHLARFPKDAAALVSVTGTILDDELTFTLTSDQTNLDLSDLENWNFWVVIYSIAGTTKTDWLIGWLPVWESNVAQLAAATIAGVTFTVVSDSGDVEWLKITRIGYPDKYVQLFDSIP